MPLKQKLLETAQKSMKMQNTSNNTPENYLNSSDTSDQDPRKHSDL